MYAVIKTSGRQYKVSEGDVITLDGFKGQPGEAVEFTEILLLEKDGQIQTGAKGSKVTGKIIRHSKGKKIRVFRYRKRKNWMRTKGSRPQRTSVSIDKIVTV